MDERNGSGAACPVVTAVKPVSDFLVDYRQRHAHPVNAALHVAGVSAAFAGFYYLLFGRKPARGAALLFVGYLLQYLGHRAQGNEVGEVTLLKKLAARAGLGCCAGEGEQAPEPDGDSRASAC